jgi:hypothetical protein
MEREIESCPYCGSINNIEAGACCICVPPYVTNHREHMEWQSVSYELCEGLFETDELHDKALG